MEKTWEEFIKTGKVTDYLEYRNSVKDDMEKTKEHLSDGAGSCFDRHGFDGHANK